MSRTPVLLTILVLGRERSQHASIQALGSHADLHVADDADDIVALVELHAPDVLIVDVSALDRDLAQWIMETRGHAALASLPIIAVGVPSRDSALAVGAFAAGMDDCLADPIDTDLLLARMQPLLRRRAETERLRLELTLVRMQIEDQRQVASDSEALGRLAGGVAHNFNNLLTVILVSSEMLMDHLPQRSAEWQHARDTHDAAQRAATLTGQLLAYSGRQMLRPVNVDLNATLRHMSSVLQDVVGDRVTLTVTPEDGLPPVHVDLSQIERVITELATHARAAMPTGGALMIETKRVVLTEAYVAQRIHVQPGVYVRLSMSDTGSGIDPVTQLHLFEPFFAPDHEASTEFGLSAVQGIVRQSGGHIWVYSEPGHGTTFKIYLPEASTRLPAARAARPQGLPRGRASVLLVDDEPIVRGVAQKVLESCGYRVATASSGEEALERCMKRGLEPDLIITDVVMPGLTGSQLVASLRSHRRNLRVLYISGFTQDVVVHHGVATGESFLSKPFTPSDLAYKVREVLSARKDVV